MSYDYQPDRANSYAELSGFVHVGYKTVVQFGTTLMPWKPFAMCRDLRTLGVDLPPTSSHFLGMMAAGRPCLASYDLMEAVLSLGDAVKRLNTLGVVTSFPPRALIEDIGEGFHVAATEKQAAGLEEGFGATTPREGKHKRKAKRLEMDSPGFYSPTASPASELHVEYEEVYEMEPPLAIVRCLMPEHALTYDGKCVRYKAIMVIPPGEKETPEDIRACDQWNQKHLGTSPRTTTIASTP